MKPLRHAIRPTRSRNQIIGIVGIGLEREEVARNGSKLLANYNYLEPRKGTKSTKEENEPFVLFVPFCG